MNTDTTPTETGEGNHSLSHYTINRLHEALEIANKSADDQMFQKREAQAEVARLRESLDLYTDIINKQDDELIRLREEVRTRRPLPDPVPTQQPTQNEWRELGKDEVIREGDEEMHRDGWIWFPVATPDIGLTPSDHRNYSFRTRRPLPKQELPLETPLDFDIEEIEAVANHPVGPRVDFYTRQLAMRSAHAIRYLRDEIQKLKEAK